VSDEKKHAEFSPSSAERWMTCPGSIASSRGLTDKSSSFADEGTAAHYMAEQILLGVDGAYLVGKTADNGVTMTADMLGEVLKYTNYVQDVVAATGGTLLVEQRLSISHITGEADAHGTSDTVILAGDELIIIDLKFGMGLRVDAENNPQLQIYALAALEEFGLAEDFKTVRMVIHQPRLNHVSEWVQSVDELTAFGDRVWNAAIDARKPDAPLAVSEKGCKFCRAKATCSAIRDEVLSHFDNVEPQSATHDKLGEVMGKADLIEGWVKAIRAETERRLFEGTPVPGFKLVQGKRGNRAWADAETAEAWLKARLKLDELYDFKLASPTTINKRLVDWVDADGEARKPVLGPRQRKELETMITQSEGKPSVAPESDKRPALVMSAEADFNDVTDLS
jgi:hypothetical protein